MPDSSDRMVSVADPILKRLFRGGFVLPHDPRCGLVVLIRGKPGTGKSTLALQVLDMMETGGRRYYCTLEQSTEDLEFKLAAMLVAQAIHMARQPDYAGDRFRCDCNTFVEQLRDKLDPIPPAFAAEAERLLEDTVLPLYAEPTPENRRNCADAEYSLGDRVRGLLKKDRIAIRDARRTDDTPPQGSFGTCRSRLVMASRMLEEVLQEPAASEGRERSKRPVVVVDGLSLLSVTERETLELQRIVERMRTCCRIGFLVYEPNEDESTSLDHHADMVIDLARRTIESPLAYLIHEMCIRKARYQEAALGQHQFKIRGRGLAFFPSLHFQVHHYNYMELELVRSRSDEGWAPRPAGSGKDPLRCERGSLIDMIFNPQRGDSVVLLGARNSFKTQLCLDFLTCGWWGCPRQFDTTFPKSEFPDLQIERGLLISLIDNAPDIERGLSCPWRKSRQGHRCQCGDDLSALITHARAFCQRPGCITPAEFFHYVKERIDPSASRGDASRCQVDRLVFWDLTQMDYRFPLFKEDKMLLPGLMDMFKTKELKSLFMGAGNAENTRAASAMADHVLFCWRSQWARRDHARELQPVPGEEGSTSSLMLYVDRASAASRRAGKALYPIPVCEGDRLLVPETTDDLEARWKIDPLSLDPNSDDAQMIKRIMNLQGVA